MVYYMLQIIEAVIFIISFGLFTSNIASSWLFSDIWED